MKYGLSDTQLDEIVKLIGSYPEIEEAILFGSRALGSYKEASDVDIALKGENVTAALAAKLKFDIEEDTYLPFFFDFVADPTITSESLREHIEQKGVSIYKAGWRTFTVEQIKADSPNALATGPFGSAISSKFFTNKGIPVIRGGNLSADISTRLYENGFVFISESKAKEFKRSEVRKGDLIFTCWGTISQVGLIDGDSSYPVYIISNKQMKLTPHPERADSLFLYYHFSNPKIQEQILGNNIGSSVPGFNLGQLKTMELNLPPLFEQRTISSVLSSLDDKIDLLHRQNKTLESMAETLFRQWFIEEAVIDSEKQILLGDLIESASITHSFPSKQVVFLNTSDIYQGDVLKHSYENIADLPGQAKKTIEKDDILFSEIRPANGRYAYIDFVATDYVVSTKLMVLRSKGIISQPFIFFYLTNKRTLDWLQTLAEARSGTFPQITFDQLRDLVINVPSEEFIQTASKLCNDWLSKMKFNHSTIQTLSNIRDTLLPKLMSGEVRVSI